MEVQLHALEILRAEPERSQFSLGRALNNLGFVQNMLSLKKEALVTFEEAVEVLSRTEARGLYARALANLAATYMLTGRLAESRELQEEALAIKRELLGSDHIEIGYSVANLSQIYQQFGDFEKAGALKREAIEIFSHRLGENHPNIGIVLGSLAANLAAQKKYAEAETTFFDSLNRIQTSFGPDSMRELPVQNGIADLYSEQGRFKEAEAHFRETLRIGMSINAEHSDVAIARAGIAKLSVSSLNDEEREQYFSEAIEQLEKNEGLGTPRAALIQLNFAAFLAGKKETSRARELFLEGLNNLIGALPADNPQYREQVSRYEAIFGMQPFGTNDDKP
jgi:tetratricopeptide (TPR) repeat protein